MPPEDLKHETIMTIEPIAVFHSPLKEKFGLPRQAGIAGSLRGTVELLPPYNCPDALRGLEGFDYVWLVWGFNLNSRETAAGGDGRKKFEATVRPPRLGGNLRVGVFASRSPFRPNGLGLSAVEIRNVDFSRCRIEVSGADLADGTPVYDIKPYVEYADSHTGIRSGFVDSHGWNPLEVEFPEDARSRFTGDQLKALSEILGQDPRPRFQNDPGRIYGLDFDGHPVHFTVRDGVLTVLDENEKQSQ